MRQRRRRTRPLHRRARLSRGGFTVARAARQWYLVQDQPLHVSDMRKELEQRGYRNFSPFDDRPFETLDREDLIRPIGYALHGFHNHDIQRSLRTGALLLRDEVGYRPWIELRQLAERRYDAQLYVLYHRWQLIHMCDVLQMLQLRSPLSHLSEGLDAYLERRAAVAAVPTVVPRDRLAEEASAARRLELLLLRVQNVFLPGVRGGRYRGGPVIGLTEEAADWARDRRRRFDASAEARAVRTDASELAATVEQLTIRGNQLDPNRDVFVLLDGMRRRYVERLRGDARRAWDFYDAARVLTRWHYELTGKRLPDVDEVFDLGGGQWKEQRYGTRRPANDRSALPALLDDFGLYPYRVELLGEGESELVALEEILDYGYGLRFERLGILTTDLGGSDVPAAARRMLSSLRRYANYFLLVLDNEGTAREMVDELLRADVIEGIPDKRRQKAVRDALAEMREQTFATDEQRMAALRKARSRGTELDQAPGEAPEHVLWKDNLEADNFTADELLVVLEGCAAEAGVQDWHLSLEALQQLLSDPQENRAIASVLVGAAADHGLVISKPDLARALARFAVDHPELGDRERPILELARHLVMLTMADRQVRGHLRER
ncbi:MAG TPA: hypothetical protein VK501_22330 [Baekduia sp.]|uniref:hypothetical protein n=1 Tax=Baekduia sp. TaxID=2600305 RepID=UPI002B7CC3C7|nr:hypothetical protein [Baekduia sp.]HMJ36659.1 hypothetical protein [Baekduia sp.]